MLLTKTVSLAILAASAAAHPGHDIRQEALERREFASSNPKTIRSCENALSKRGHVEGAVERRANLARKARAKRGLLQKRDFAEYNTSHLSTEDFNLGTPETELYKDNTNCILQPDVTQGPFYVNGEMIRSDIVDGEEGVPVYLDVQFIDVSTCEPATAVMVDLWHANSTGVYSGVTDNTNGNGDDLTNLKNVALRGVQSTDFNGVVQFETILPSFYSGRASHMHIMTHPVNSTVVRANGTILAEGYNFTTSYSHIGQIFFDDELVGLAHDTYPYSTVTADRTYNADDQILTAEAEDMDPIAQWQYLGDTVSDGVLAWIRIGIDGSADATTQGAAAYYADGGVANSASSSGSGGPGGDAPSGSGAPAIPSGTDTTEAA